MKPKLQCPNCLQFELKFGVYKSIAVSDHQEARFSNTDIRFPDTILRCGAFDCNYTGPQSEFETGE